jgi:hypothetical protein
MKMYTTTYESDGGASGWTTMYDPKGLPMSEDQAVDEMNRLTAELAQYREANAAAMREVLGFRQWVDGLKKNPSTPDSPLMSMAFNILGQLSDQTDEAQSVLPGED